MKLPTKILIISLSIALTACYNSKSLEKTSETPASNNSKGVQNVSEISIMHVDLSQRIITLKSNEPLASGFYLSHDKNGQFSSAFKLNNSSSSILYEADILEGRPRISDTVIIASTEQSTELSIKYKDRKVD